MTLAGALAERYGTAPVFDGAGVLLLVVGLTFAAARREAPRHGLTRDCTAPRQFAFKEQR